MKWGIFVIALILIAILGWQYFGNNVFSLPEGDTVAVSVILEDERDEEITFEHGVSGREQFTTEGVAHSIPLHEILSGGPGKDGIPSIDDPQFLSASEVDFIESEDIGLGVEYKGELRFYPYQILVWHEIVNDRIAGDPLLVTYCPLCQTGIVFERKVDGVEREFGVSGRLWKSNLLMYDRTGNEDTESLWSQVLGEAVLGPRTGERLSIVTSDTVRYGDWIAKHPTTMVLSKDTGAVRFYGDDPYGDYYTNEDVSFGARFNDDRLHPKAFVLGIEVGGKYKAYDLASLPVGELEDHFGGETVTIEKSAIDEVRMFLGKGRSELSYIGGFWFSWLSVHPETALFSK